MNVSVRSCNVVHLKTATNWWTSHTSHQPSCTKPHTGEQIFLFGFTGGCEVNDNESKDLFYGVWPHPCCVDEWEGAISVDIQTVNIQTIYLNQIAQHSFTPTLKCCLRACGQHVLGICLIIPVWLRSTVSYCCVFLSKKSFEPTQLTFIMRKNDGGQSLPISWMPFFIYTTAVRGASISTSCIIGIFDEIMTFTPINK